MPSIEKHVEYCIKAFGRNNEALCYQVNSWMDAPSRNLGSGHRVLRHDLEQTIVIAIREFLSDTELKALSSKIGEMETPASIGFHTPKNVNGKITWEDKEEWKQKAGLITNIIIQHLMLDGLLTQRDFSRMQQEGLTLDLVRIIRDIEEKRKYVDIPEQAKRKQPSTNLFSPNIVLSLICGLICSFVLSHDMFGSVVKYGGLLGVIVLLLLGMIAFSLPFLFIFTFLIPKRKQKGNDKEKDAVTLNREG